MAKSARPSTADSQLASHHNGARSTNATNPVTAFIITCTAASRLAFAVAATLANSAVTVVPKLAPMTTAAPANGLNIPLAEAVNTIASAADDDCTKAVSSKPISSASTMPKGPVSVKRSTGITVTKWEKLVDKVSIPTNSTPKPAIARPTSPKCLPWRTMRSNMPTPIIGQATIPILNFKPTKATNHAVMVVPTLLPNTTHAAWRKVSMPALVKPNSATTTADDDCTNAVMAKPENAARRRVAVPFCRNPCSRSPAAALRPSVSNDIPSNNRPKPPNAIKPSRRVTGDAP
ncbi:MAG: Uncharacterised protein [Pseudidiomarina mangrovi]|nr:MAG: Uncharacterised protein [Pseudidiomarina mangrovi]